MALEEYRRKRDFSATPEPSGDPVSRPQQAARDGGAPGWHDLPEGHRYCVQMHRATRLHYDFRIEWNGVLLSWPVFRGPSLDPAKKRMAVQTEDHPVDYGDFEGVIPSGYGMGTVELWDIGTYEWTRESAEDPDRQLQKGDIKFRLDGRKLKGEFALVRIGERGLKYGGVKDGERNFLMIKKRDDEAVEGYDAAEHDWSVKTGRSLDEIAAEAGGDPRQKARERRQAAREGRGPRTPAPKGEAEPPSAPQLPSLRQLPSPMLATAVDAPFSRPGWLFEMKYDGVRAIVAVAGGRVRAAGRRGRDETERYPELLDAARRITASSAVLDCEIVVLDEAGRPDFERLQSRINCSGAAEIRRAQQRDPVTVVAFDLLAIDGRNMMATDLRIRKKTLREAIRPGGALLFADHVDTDGEGLFAAAREQGLEGIVAKRGDSQYQPGRRGADWLKIKAWQTQDCVIAGWTQGHGRRGHLGALVIAVADGDGFVHAGSVGTGLDEPLIRALLDDLRGRVSATCPLRAEPRLKEVVTWVRPEVVCEVRHAGWTQAGLLRHPSFRALRGDVAPRECAREAVTATAAAVTAAHDDAASAVPPGRRRHSTAAAAVSAADDEVEEALQRLRVMPATGTWEVAGRRLKLTNLDKVFWPEDSLTKRDMVDYYVRMAPLLLPYLRERPLSTQVFPDGIAGKSFWRKDKPTHAPDWIRSWPFRGEGGTKHWIVCEEVATLGWLANAGVVDLHPWHSRVDAPEQPDWAVYDLDPFEPASFDDVKDIARLVRAALGHYGLRGFPKTSGQTGLQIYVPLRRGPDYAAVRGWVEDVARAIGRIVPERISWEWTVSKRTGKIRIDYTQNILNKTLAAPYSLRPGPGAPASAPIAWEELDDATLRPDRWTIRDIGARVAEVGDLFLGVLDGDQDLPGPRG
jgi:bifunctional non-homologous end joining protein LigD